MTHTKAIAAALNRSRLKYAHLQHSISRDNFRGKIVILGGLLQNSKETTHKWVCSLPTGTCLIVVNNGSEKSVFPLVDFLAAQQPPEQSTVFWDKQSPLWTGLPAGMMGLASCPPYRLTEPKGLTALKVLAGHRANDGSVFPLAMECRDLAGRMWLIWNLPQAPAEHDPRWDLLLRNSLLWAHRHLAVTKNRQNAKPRSA